MVAKVHGRLSRREFLRALSFSAGGLAAASLLAACAQPPAAAPTAAPAATAAPVSAATEPPATPAEASAGPVTLRLWTMNDPAWIKSAEAQIQKWQGANAGSTIKYENFPYDEFIQTIQTGMAAKNEADLIQMFGTWVQPYAKGGTIAAMPDDVVSLAEARDLYYTAPLDGYVWEGKLYGLPQEFNIENGGVLVNKRIFGESGVAYPPEWPSWDALVTDARKLTKWDGQTMTVAGFHYLSSDTIAFLLWEGILERGADYFADDKIHLNFLSPQAEETVQWMYDMATKDKVVDPLTFNSSVADVADAFFKGQVAIGYRGPWVVAAARSNYPDFADPWNYVAAPHYGEKMSFAADSGWGLVVSPHSQNMKAAWQFAKSWAMDAENARGFNVGTGTVPALKKVAEDPSLLKDIDWIGPSLKVLPYGRFVGNFQDRDFVWYTSVETQVNAALQGQQTVKEALEKMQKEVNEMIDSKLKS